MFLTSSIDLGSKKVRKKGIISLRDKSTEESDDEDMVFISDQLKEKIRNMPTTNVLLTKSERVDLYEILAKDGVKHFLNINT